MCEVRKPGYEAATDEPITTLPTITLGSAIEIDANFAPAHNNLGIVLLQKGQLGEAVFLANSEFCHLEF
jgi:hypothetical protein